MVRLVAAVLLGLRDHLGPPGPWRWFSGCTRQRSSAASAWGSGLERQQRQRDRRPPPRLACREAGGFHPRLHPLFASAAALWGATRQALTQAYAFGYRAQRPLGSGKAGAGRGNAHDLTVCRHAASGEYGHTSREGKPMSSRRTRKTRTTYRDRGRAGRGDAGRAGPSGRPERRRGGARTGRRGVLVLGLHSQQGDAAAGDRVPTPAGTAPGRR